MKDSITLEAGNEYFIELTPIGQSVTSQFKTMGYKDRRCRLSNETLASSTLKMYNKQNCIYECMVHYAMEKCACTAWDFH